MATSGLGSRSAPPSARAATPLPWRLRTAEGSQEIDSVSITVEAPPNVPPTPHIISPAEGDTFLTTDSIAFTDSAEDGTLKEASRVWTSDLDDEIGTGTSFNASLSAGTHSITLTATASQGVTGIDSVSITVEAPPNLPPTASITNPLIGEFYLTADNIPFSGSANDLQDGALTGASLVWTSDLDGEFGTGESFSASLSAGTQSITLTATDSQGAEGIDSVSITVEAPAPQPVPVGAIPLRQPFQHILANSRCLHRINLPL